MVNRYFVVLMSPQTYEAFSESPRDSLGFRNRHRALLENVSAGDKLVCYLPELGRWVGVLSVQGALRTDSSPDSGNVTRPWRLPVSVESWLDKARAIPIRNSKVWSTLSFTRSKDKDIQVSLSKLRVTLTPIDAADGQYLERIIASQVESSQMFSFDVEDYAAKLNRAVTRADRGPTHTVIPDIHDYELDELFDTNIAARETFRVHATLANIGAKMGYKLWIPPIDRAAVYKEWRMDKPPVLDSLDLDFEPAVLESLANIDLLWIEDDSIVRGFEIDHSYSIHMGFLRIADIYVILPGINFPLHLVAPDSRRTRIFQEVQRPVFTLMTPGPLAEFCTFLSYESVRELSELKQLQHGNDALINAYAEDIES